MIVATLVFSAWAATRPFGPIAPVGPVATPDVTKALVFVADQGANAVDIFAQNAVGLKKVGAVTNGISSPDGLAIGPSHELYVTDVTANVVSVYAKPYTGAPIRTFVSGVANPIFVAVSPAGTTYISDYFAGVVTEYPAGNAHPSRTLAMPPDGYPQGLALAPNGDLYVTYYNTYFQVSHVVRFLPHSPRALDQGITIGYGQGLTFDKSGNMLIADQGTGIDVFPPNATSPSRVYKVTNPFQLAFSASGKRLYVSASADKGVDVLAYPSGKTVETLPGSDFMGTGGIAVDPGL